MGTQQEKNEHLAKMKVDEQSRKEEEEALKEKFEKEKDQLILNALEKNAGAAEWARKNEQERQQDLIKFKLEQKRLKKDGKETEAAQIVDGLMKQDENMNKLLEDKKSEQKKKIQERLAARKAAL